MAILYRAKENNPIVFRGKKAGLSRTDIARALNVSNLTLREWIHNPYLIRFGDLLTLAGLFSMSVEELVYILVRNKPNVDARLSKEKNGKWYIESIREKHK
jgi:transcriptional regulator with XRE-family HTH domain